MTMHIVGLSAVRAPSARCRASAADALPERNRIDMSTPPPDPQLDNTDHPILNLPLSEVMRPQIALTLQHMLQIYTVGSFLNAWRNPRYQKSIEQVFDTPQQARHAVAVCATWLGVPSDIAHAVAGAWWSGDDRPFGDA
jgi:hypothetical protein